MALYSSLDVPAERLAEVADRTREKVAGWIRTEADVETIDVFLCATPEELQRLEAERTDAPEASWRRHAGGGYYHESRTVLILVTPGLNLEWLVSHEMVHSVFRDVARSYPVALNEGLAEVLPSWVLFGETETPETNRATYDDYERVVARLVEQGRIPALEEFLRWSPDTFHADRWASFALSWSLTRFLIETEDPRLRARVPQLVCALGAGGDPWVAFSSVYDAPLVEELWNASIGNRPQAGRR